MEIRIGITGSPREITIDTDLSPEDLRTIIEDSVAKDSKVLAFNDDKGRNVLIPASALAYVEFGTESERRVGFVS